MINYGLIWACGTCEGLHTELFTFKCAHGREVLICEPWVGGQDGIDQEQETTNAAVFRVQMSNSKQESNVNSRLVVYTH